MQQLEMSGKGCGEDDDYNDDKLMIDFIYIIKFFELVQYILVE